MMKNIFKQDKEELNETIDRIIDISLVVIAIVVIIFFSALLYLA